MRGLVDTHTHTWFSHDSKGDPKLSCQVAIEKGLKGIAFTDHCDVELHFYDTKEDISKSVENARNLKKEFDGRLEVFVGVEMGVSKQSSETAKRIMDELGELDEIIYSVHCLDWKGEMVAFSRLDFQNFPDSEINEFFKVYFDEVYSGLLRNDADILPHLTCPEKYVKKYGKTVDFSRFSREIDDILRLVVKKDMALEINVSNGIDESVVDKYLSLGGAKFTLGSDAHTPEDVGNGFDKWTQYLKNKGVDKVYYFSKRKPILLKI